MSEVVNDQSIINDFNLRRQLNKYLRYKWLFFISGLIAALSVLGYLKLRTPLFGIYGSIIIKDEKKGEPSDFPFRDIDVFDDRNIVDNESEIIRSRTLVGSVVSRLQLNVNYYGRDFLLKYSPVNYSSPIRIKTVKESETLYSTPLDIQLIDTASFKLINNGKIFRYNETIHLGGAQFIVYRTEWYAVGHYQIIRVTISSVAETTQAIRDNLSVAQTTKNASMLNLSLLHPVPAQGIDILNAVIDEYNKSNLDYRDSQTTTTVKIIQERLDLVADELNNIGHSEENYKSRMGITQLSADAQSFLDKAKESDKLITDSRIKMEVLKSIKEYTTTTPGTGIPPTAGLTDPVLPGLVARLNELELEKSELKKTVGSENIKVKIKAAQADDLRKNILENIQTQEKNIRAVLGQLTGERARIDSEIRSVPLNERNLTKIVREKNIQESIYNYLLQKREEANIAAASAYSKLRVIDAAYSSTRPIKPNKIIVILTALLFALALPFAYINIRESLNKKLSDPFPVYALNTPLIGGISMAGGGKSDSFTQNGYSFISEQFRILIARLKSEVPHCKTILVTSSEPAEGKSYTSTHIAEVLAIWDKKVILIDADLRKGKLSRELNMDPSKPGLSDFLTDQQVEITDVISTIGQNNYTVDVIVSGNEKPAIFKFQSGNRLNSLFEYLRANYDYIIINTPPVKLVSDALFFVKYCDITLYVVRHGYTHKSSLEFISGLSKKETLGKMYIVLNGFPGGHPGKGKKYRQYFEVSKS